MARIAAWSRPAARPALLLPLLAIPACLPYFQNGLPKGSDSLMHLMRQGALDYALRHGTLYPRWTPELMLGHGYPVFNFYGPLAYYVTEIWRLLGLGYYAAFVVTGILVVLAAGYGMYLLARDVFGSERPWAALLAACAYMYAPYFLTNLYVRGAIAETGAQALLPWVLWGFRRVLVSDRLGVYVLPAALSLGALAICHNITLLFVPPVLVAYGALLWWRGGRQPARLRWAVLAGLAAIGASAFFILPLAGERSYLITSPYAVSRYTLPENAWRWDAFLDPHLLYSYSFAIPFRLGLVQVALALGGLLLARRRDAEWWFLAVVALVSGLGITQAAVPVWLNVPLLLIAQFPWRLLSIMSLPLALLAGGCVARIRLPHRQAAAALPLLALVLITQAPRLGSWIHYFAPDATWVTPAVTAQLEVGTRALGASGIEEFRPRWAQDDVRLAPDPDLASVQATITPIRGNAYDVEATVNSVSGGPLRLMTYYYPGWRVTLDGTRPLAAYPSTNLGLLTVDLPPGQHRLLVTWAGTPLQRAGGILTVVTLAGLTWLAWRQRGQRGWAALPAALLAMGLLAMAWQRPLAPIQGPGEPVTSPGLRLLGYRLEQGQPLAADPHLYVYPYWSVNAAQPAGLRVRWQVLDAGGRPVAESTLRPYFGIGSAADWPAGSLVDDAYEVALPPGMPPGTYRVAAQVLADADADAAGVPGALVGAFTLPSAIPGQPAAPNTADFRMGETVRLAGYAASVAGQPLTPGPRPPVVRAGQVVDYKLYWQGLAPVTENYFGFVHLIDKDGRPLAGHDQTPGPMFHPSMLWDTYYLQPDHHLLWIPQDAASGLYWPLAGLHGFKSQDQLPVYDAAGNDLADGARLPPLKILGAAPPAPGRPAAVRFGDLGTFIGYDLALPAGGVHPGAGITLTLQYRVAAATDRDYTRFVHVYNAAGQIAGADSQPAGGANPTRSWVPGEIVLDQARLSFGRDVPLGRYDVAIGLYDHAASDARLPAFDAQGRLLPDARVVLTSIEITP